jgi:hypothetical protein
MIHTKSKPHNTETIQIQQQQRTRIQPILQNVSGLAREIRPASLALVIVVGIRFKVNLNIAALWLPNDRLIKRGL